MSSRRYADTGVLSLAPLKFLAQSARVVPSVPHAQPPCTEPLPTQVEEGLAMATAVEESGAPPLPVTAAAVEEGRTTAEAAAPQAALEPPAEVGSSGADVVMVLSDEASALPPLAGVVMS
jgi:hypothetical protein